MIFDPLDHVAFDFETSGNPVEYALQPWRVAQGTAWATSLAVYDRARNAVTGGLSPTEGNMRLFLQEAIRRQQYIVGWNVQFDIQWLLAYGLEDLVMEAKWLDGMLLWRHQFIEPEYEAKPGKKASYGLKGAVAKFIPEHAGYEENVDFHSTDPVELERLHKYNVKDTLFTSHIASTIWKQLSHQQRRCALIEAECLPMIAKANFDGMCVDMFAAHELQAKLAKDADERLTLLLPFGVDETVVRSPLKLSKLLFDEWQLPVLKENVSKTTGKTSRSTDKEVLHELAFQFPRAKTIKEYREALNNKTKFADTILAAADHNLDGKARPQAIPFGTYSGRLTYSSAMGKGKEKCQTGFALHQTKRGEEYRSLIVPPPGYELVEFDAAGQEFRWMAIASGDQTMLNLCMPGEDPHAYMAARIVNRDYHELMRLQTAADAAIKAAAKDDRQLGKVANLSLQYRTSARKLRSVARVQYNIPMELPQAQLIHRTYQLTYPMVPRYWDRQIAIVKKQGYVETYANRRVYVSGDWDGSMGWSMGSTSINYRIQGTGADQKYLALMCLKNELRQEDSYFGWDLHDGIYLYVPKARVDKAIPKFKNILDNLPYKAAWGFEPPIPLPFDCKRGGSWGLMKEVKL